MKRASLSELLALLRHENEADAAGAQRVAPPQPLGKVPTLELNCARAASPQLAERFGFAGRWQDAVLGTTWLSIADMGSAARSRALKEQVALRAQNWPRSAPARFSPARLSLFAVDEDDQNETYLVWDRPEPRLFEYFNSSERIHRDLRAYLRHHLATALALGPATPPVAVAGVAVELADYLADDETRIDRWVEGLQRWGMPTLTRAAVASARLLLPLLERAHPGDERPRRVLQLAEAWADCPCEAHAAPIHPAGSQARPISPALSGSEALFEAGHAVCYAAFCAAWGRLDKRIARYDPATRSRLEALVDRKPGEVAALLNAEALPAPSGALFTAATAKSALERVRYCLEGAGASAANAASTAAKVLGKPTVVRAAIRDELARGSRQRRS